MRHLLALVLASFFALSSATVWSATVDINSADARLLDTALVGVGPKAAAAIVEYRTKHGPFKSIDELSKVKGIGEKTIEKNRDRISVGGATKGK